tara:strand:- start:9370 stop:9576 length:207 start_codon:yes stop_codon:yes gene_type:complete
MISKIFKKKRPPKPILLPEELNEELNEELSLPNFVKRPIVWQSKKRIRPKFTKVSDDTVYDFNISLKI